jgi:hypothetical protein
MNLINDKIATQLSDILAARAQRAQTLDTQVMAWSCMRDALRDLVNGLGELSSHRSSPDGLCALADLAVTADLAGKIDREVLPRLRRVKQRFSRGRLNIGVAGKARVGKSTLLKAISGLDEDQIPTGDDLPVTAVRSRIFHSTFSRAIVAFHTWETFRASVLQPYFTRLGLGPTPASPEIFRRYVLPSPQGEAENAAMTSALRDRVKRMVASLDSYLGLLKGETKEVPLSDLRRFVAYPSSEEERRGSPERQYLAVREVNIECPFPGISVRQLGLIDLPGTGEIVAAGEDRHVVGLEDEVDAVLLVTNPGKLAHWDHESASTLDLVLSARCGATPQDFATLIINVGGASHAQTAALRDEIKTKLRDAHGDSNFRTIECDAKDSENVRENLVLPILAHLAERLPFMDAAALVYAELGLEGVERDISALLVLIDKTLNELVPATTPSEILLVSMAEDLRAKLSISFSQVVAERLMAARTDSGDLNFEEAVAACYDRVRSWIVDGLGLGDKKFINAAEKSLSLNKDSGGHSAAEFNRIRVHLSSEFTSLDNHLAEQVDTLWTEVWTRLAQEFGRDISEPAHLGLSALQRDLRSARCFSMAAAIADLLSLRLDYRTHFHPRLRRQLDLLNPQEHNPESGELRSKITVAPTLDGAHEMLRLLREYGERGAWEAQKALLHDLSVPALVLHASAEQFDDAFIRSGDGKKEFLLFAHNQRDKIWPGTFEQLDQAHQLFSACRTKLSSATAAAAQVRGGVA